MALKLVDATQLDSDLTSVADAIRTAGGTSALLTFPEDFVSAIGDLSGGAASNVVLPCGSNIFAPTGDPTHTYAFLDLTTPSQSPSANVTTRNSLWSFSGEHPAQYYSSNYTTPPFADSRFYPIEIPAGKTNATITATNSGQFSLHYCYYENEWKQISTSGWVNVGSNPVEIPSNATHIVVTFRTNENNSPYDAHNVLYDAEIQFS